MIPFPK